MATTHHLFSMAQRTAVETDAAVPVAGRTKLTVTLLVAAITGTLTVVLEAAPVGGDTLWRTLATFDVNAAGAYTKTCIGGADWIAKDYDRILRARIVGVTDCTFEVTMAAPWMDATADVSLFSKELRVFADGYARILGDAEDAVMNELSPRVNSPEAVRPFYPTLVPAYSRADEELRAGLPHALAVDADMTLPGFGAAIRAAIVRQAEHLFQRHKLSQKEEPSAVVSLRTFPPLAPGLMDGLARYRNQTSTVWRGR